MILYHATKARFIDDIKKHGLNADNTKGGNNQTKNEPLYFFDDINKAANCTIYSENTSDKWKNDRIMIIVLSSEVLNKEDIVPESSVKSVRAAYKGEVQSESLFVVNFKTDSAEPIVCVDEFMPEYHYGQLE